MLETIKIYSLKTTKERIHKFEGMLIGISQTEMQRGRKKRQNRIFKKKNYGTIKKNITYLSWKYQEKKRKRQNKYL